MKRASLPFPHLAVPSRRSGRLRLTADKDFYGHSTDASRSHRGPGSSIAPGSPDDIVQQEFGLDAWALVGCLLVVIVVCIAALWP